MYTMIPDDAGGSPTYRFDAGAYDRYEVTVGYDAPAETFFASVVDRRASDGTDPIVVKVGNRRIRFVGTVEELAHQMRPYVELPVDLRAMLAADQRQYGPPTREDFEQERCGPRYSYPFRSLKVAEDVKERTMP